MDKLILILSFFFHSFLVDAQTCKDLPANFLSYSNAATAIKSATFKFEDKVDFSSSSWISKATYHSCDDETGYFILTTQKGNEYIHQNLPINVWKQFKEADSFGDYYNRKIKGKYQLIIK